MYRETYVKDKAIIYLSKTVKRLIHYKSRRGAVCDCHSLPQTVDAAVVGLISTRSNELFSLTRFSNKTKCDIAQWGILCNNGKCLIWGKIKRRKVVRNGVF